MSAKDIVATNDSASLPPVESRRAGPTYAAAFHCIGASCEDTCCAGWGIPVDKQTYEKYRQFPLDKLGSVVSQYVSIAAASGPDSLYARIEPAPSGFCPFFTTDRLCGIQKEYGSHLLPATCSIYPRALNQVDGVLEGSLSLSCPEAARNVLLDPNAMQVAGDLLSGDFRTDNFFRLASNRAGSIHKPYGSFHAVRALLIDMVKDRSRPIWQRLLLIGSLCKRLDEITTAEEDETVPAILGEYREVLANHWLHAELEGMPNHLRVKLNVIQKLTEERVSDSTSGQRFRDTHRMFVEGIILPPGATPGDVSERYLEAEERYYRPFFAKSPFILENYLLNYIFKNLFPFGHQDTPHYKPQSIFDEYILMTTQFAWITTLIIGMAGYYKDDFAEEHVIRAVQSFTRAVEHSPNVLIWINACVRNWKLDSLHGMAVLLRS